MKTANEFLAAFSSLPKIIRTQVVSKILKLDLMTDAEVAATLRISPGQVREHLRNGPPRGRTRNAFDIRTVRRLRIGRSRIWLRSSLMAAINGDTE